MRRKFLLKRTPDLQYPPTWIIPVKILTSVTPCFLSLTHYISTLLMTFRGFWMDGFSRCDNHNDQPVHTA